MKRLRARAADVLGRMQVSSRVAGKSIDAASAVILKHPHRLSGIGSLPPAQKASSAHQPTTLRVGRLCRDDPSGAPVPKRRGKPSRTPAPRTLEGTSFEIVLDLIVRKREEDTSDLLAITVAECGEVDRATRGIPHLVPATGPEIHDELMRRTVIAPRSGSPPGDRWAHRGPDFRRDRGRPGKSPQRAKRLLTTAQVRVKMACRDWFREMAADAGGEPYNEVERAGIGTVAGYQLAQFAARGLNAQ